MDILRCRVFPGIGTTYNLVVHTHSGATVSFLIYEKLVMISDEDKQRITEYDYSDILEVYGKVEVQVGEVDLNGNRAMVTIPDTLSGYLWVDLDILELDRPDVDEPVLDIEIDGAVVTIEPIEMPSSPLEEKPRKSLT